MGSLESLAESLEVTVDYIIEEFLVLSTQTRLKVQFLCARIERGEPVELSDMAWLQKWAKTHRSVRDMLSKARRRAINGVPEPGTIDDLLDQLNLGEPDPSRHITGQSSIDDLADFFTNGDDSDAERMRRD